MIKYHIIPVTPLQQNCSLVWCTETKEAVLIDAGGDLEKLKPAISQRGLTLTGLWLTHGHFDHAGGAHQLRLEYQVPVLGPSHQDEFWLEGIEQHSQMYGIDHAQSVAPDQWLSDGQQLSLGAEVFHVLSTPGHTPGHVTFYHEAQQLAWVGDVLFAGSIGRTDFPKGDLNTLIASITQKLWPLGEQVTFIPGHGPCSTFGQERKTNPFVSDQALRRR